MKQVLLMLLSLMLLTAPALAETFPPTSVPTIPGIDVSSWQRVIDWQQVRASGIRIAMLRASEGTDFTDPYFERNYAEAKAAGLDVGFYHFCTAATEAEAVQQADWFIRVITGKTPDCLLALDYGGGADLSPTAITANADAFLARVETVTGYGVMLYTDAWAARARFGASVTRYPIWVANYGVTAPEANGQWASWVGFQYSDRGQISGISGHVDLDDFTRQVYQGSGPTPTPTPVPGAETSYYRVPITASAETIAARLGTTAARLDSLNDLVNGQAQTGQILRYPSSQSSNSQRFSGLHIRQQGESLASVARHYGTTESTLLSLNALSFAPAGQVLRIPLVSGRTAVPAPPSWLLENVVVAQTGQTLSSVAAQYGRTSAELATINGLTSETVYRGQLLHITPYGKGTEVGFSGGYVVNQGDTLIRIAARFGTTASAIYAINNIASASVIWPGQVLLLPE